MLIQPVPPPPCAWCVTGPAPERVTSGCQRRAAAARGGDSGLAAAVGEHGNSGVAFPPRHLGSRCGERAPGPGELQPQPRCDGRPPGRRPRCRPGAPAVGLVQPRRGPGAVGAGWLREGRGGAGQGRGSRRAGRDGSACPAAASGSSLRLSPAVCAALRVPGHGGRCGRAGARGRAVGIGGPAAAAGWTGSRSAPIALLPIVFSVQQSRDGTEVFSPPT